MGINRYTYSTLPVLTSRFTLDHSVCPENQDFAWDSSKVDLEFFSLNLKFILMARFCFLSVASNLVAMATKRQKHIVNLILL